MPIKTPARRTAFTPIGKLRGSYHHSGKKGLMLSLNLTPMVDMFTVIVIFLLQSFAASGDIMFVVKDLKLPKAKEASLLEDRGPVVTLFGNRVIMEGKEIARMEEMDEAESGIPALSEALVGIRERDEKLFGRDPTKPFDGQLIIQADKETDFMLVRKTIYSANEAGWAHLNFTVLGEGGGAPAEGEH